ASVSSRPQAASVSSRPQAAAVSSGPEAPAMLSGPQAAAATPAEYALIATQGDGDEAALETALRSTARAVLVIASTRKAERLRAAMSLRGLPETRIEAMRAPAGPNIGAVTPTEIALAAIAGLVALRRGHPAEGGKRPKSSAINTANVIGYVNPVCG